MHRLEGIDHASLLESAPDAVVIVAADDTIIFVNAQTERMFGHPRGDVVGRPVDMLLPARLRGSRALHAETAARGVPRALDLLGERKGGAEFPIEVQLSPIEGKHGIIVSVSIRDVSARKRSEQETARLRSSQDLLLQSVAEGILGLDAAGAITFANPAAARLLGYTLQEIVALQEHAHLHHHRADGSPYPEELCPVHRSLADGSKHHASGEVFWKKNGQSLAVDLTVAPLRVGDAIVGASIIFTDISDRLKTDAAAREASIARPLARRILQDLIEQGGVPHQVLTQVGRKFASETSSGSLAEHLAAYRAMGLGTIVVDKKEGGRYAFSGQDLLERRMGSRVATCAFALGYLSEAVSDDHEGQPTLGTEIECQSRGAAQCRFVVQVRKPEEGLARRVKELI